MDILVTGEVKQHVGLEAMESGFSIAAAGHYATEQPGVAWLRDRLAESMPEIGWITFEPAIGTSGRPWSLG
jgi:putative NIF3 family GTP cyclohydrolase 1 type 2